MNIIYGLTMILLGVGIAVAATLLIYTGITRLTV